MKFQLQKLVDEFLKDYRKYGKFNLEVQAPHLAKLASHYEKKFMQTKDWKDCLKVSIPSELTVHLKDFTPCCNIRTSQTHGHILLFAYGKTNSASLGPRG